VSGGIEFHWDAENIGHLKRHCVTPDEFEELMGNDPMYLEYQAEADEERYKVLGVTKAGRVLSGIWYKNRARLDKDLVDAAKKGKLKRLDQATLKDRLAASKSRVVSIRLPENDIELARKQAEQKGLPYQTYIKSVLHQALRQAK
jgi:predicted DNA binding CopG/RHH family protein